MSHPTGPIQTAKATIAAHTSSRMLFHHSSFGRKPLRLCQIFTADKTQIAAMAASRTAENTTPIKMLLSQNPESRRRQPEIGPDDAHSRVHLPRVGGELLNERSRTEKVVGGGACLSKIGFEASVGGHEAVHIRLDRGGP